MKEMRDFKREIADVLAGQAQIKDAELSADDLYELLEIPAEAGHGDYAFPCFQLAKALRRSPQQIASDISADGYLTDSNDVIEKVEAVNAYVNFFLNRSAFIRDTVEAVLINRGKFGGGDDNGLKVIAEFSSPNIAKPFHIGHIRSTVIGSSIEHIYKHLGYDTYKMNHLGDYGTQFGKLIVAYKKWGKREDVEREPIATLQEYYVQFHKEADKDPSLEDEARDSFARLEQGCEEEMKLWKWFRDESLVEFGRVYDMLGISFDEFDGESFFSDKMPRFIKEMEDGGILVESDGAHIVDLAEYDMPIAMITKKDGSTLYITRDIAAAVYRKENYHFYKNLYIVGSQQILYFKQLFKVLELLGYDWVDQCVHIPFGLVSLEDGALKSRYGNVVYLEDVLNATVDRTREIVLEKGVNTEEADEIARKVGIGAVIFNELSAARIKDYVFSWDKLLNFDGETGPYVQYVYARAASVLRKGKEAGAADPADAQASGVEIDYSYIESDAAFALARLIHSFPGSVLLASERYEPSYVTRHIVDVAQAFNRFYHDETVLVENEDERDARLALVYAAKQVIGIGLSLLGIEAPEKM